MIAIMLMYTTSKLKLMLYLAHLLHIPTSLGPVQLLILLIAIALYVQG